MAGLPCDVCQEDTIVIPLGTVGEDAAGILFYRRYRVCVNPNCERYRQRRTSLEAYLPEDGPPVLVERAQLRPYLPPERSSHPSLFDEF